VAKVRALSFVKSVQHVVVRCLLIRPPNVPIPAGEIRFGASCFAALTSLVFYSLTCSFSHSFILWRGPRAPGGRACVKATPWTPRYRGPFIINSLALSLSRSLALARSLSRARSLSLSRSLSLKTRLPSAIRVSLCRSLSRARALSLKTRLPAAIQVFFHGA
jgi:hypothetical protein